MIPSVSALCNAGVEFCLSNGDISSIKFDKRKKKFYLPHLQLNVNSDVPYIDIAIEDVNKYYYGTRKVKVYMCMKKYVYGSWQILTFLAAVLVVLLMAAYRLLLVLGYGYSVDWFWMSGGVCWCGSAMPFGCFCWVVDSAFLASVVQRAVLLIFGRAVPVGEFLAVLFSWL
ncbi:putative UPF0481 protein [Camellia lanceoleosa]|nr:putative UPF0481 protein [Camellia lanceoleosa]